MQPGRHAERARDALDQVTQAYAFERRVVRVAGCVLARVAGQSARESDVFHPRDACLPFVRFGRNKDRATVGDALDVGRDPEGVVGRAEDGGRPDDRPREVGESRELGLAPSLAFAIVEGSRGLAAEGNEILLARRLSVQVRVYARRTEDVAMAFEVPGNDLHLVGLGAG